MSPRDDRFRIGTLKESITSTKQLFVTLALAIAGIGTASAADPGYQNYLHNLDAANTAAEHAIGTVTGQDGYASYQRINGWLDSAGNKDLKVVMADGYQAYQHILGWN